MIETQSSRNSTQILCGQLDPPASTQVTETNESQKSLTVAQLTQKEIYARIASNIELIGLYLATNEKIINEPDSNPSRLFRNVTHSLGQIK